MKKFFYVLLMTFVMVGLGSCSGKMDLTGTTWVGSHNMDFGEIVDDMEEAMDFAVTTTLTFTSASEGNMQFSLFGETADQPFTYTCDSKGNGLLSGFDIEDGSPLESKFTVNGDKLTVIEDGDTFEFQKQ